VAVNRQATGANQDAVAVVGTFLPAINFGLTTPLVTPDQMSVVATRSCCACSLLVGSASAPDPLTIIAFQPWRQAKPANSPALFRRAVLLGLGAGCKSSSNEKLDAGQRKYCSESG